LGIRFEETDGELKLYTPDGREFTTREKRVEEIQEELRKTQMAFEEERQRALNALRIAEAERAAKEALAAKLRELGFDPESVLKPTA
jgi:predicted transposase YdaD